MQLARPVIAADPRSFGRNLPPARPAPGTPARLGDDRRLFAMTFLAGFLFFSVFLA